MAEEPEAEIESDDSGASDGWEKLLGNDALQKRVIQKGDESRQRPEKGDSVVVVATVVINQDETVEQDKEHRFRIGEGDVCQAWDMAIRHMFPGEKSKVRSSYRFDKRDGAKEGSTIQYQLELREIISSKAIPDMSTEERIEYASAKREVGKQKYSKKDFSSARQSFELAIKALEPSDDIDQAGKQSLLVASVPCWNNLAATNLKIAEVADASIDTNLIYKLVIEDCDKVLRIDPRNTKAMYRKAKALLAVGNFEDSIKVLEIGVAMELEDGVLLKRLLAAATNVKAKSHAKDRELYGKMLSAMGSSPDILKLEEEREKKEKKMVDNQRRLTYILAVIAVLVPLLALVVHSVLKLYWDVKKELES